MGYTYIDHVTGDLLDRYTHGQLSDSELDSIEDHVLFCRRCRSRVLATVSLVESLKNPEWVLSDALGPDWSLCFRRTTRLYWPATKD